MKFWAWSVRILAMAESLISAKQTRLRFRIKDLGFQIQGSGFRVLPPAPSTSAAFPGNAPSPEAFILLSSQLETNTGFWSWLELFAMQTSVQAKLALPHAIFRLKNVSLLKCFLCVPLSSHIMYLFTSFQKSTSPQNFQVTVYYTITYQNIQLTVCAGVDLLKPFR